MSTSEQHLTGYVLQPGEGRRIPVPFGGSEVTMKAESYQTGGCITVFESHQEPDSVGPARHFHQRTTELFYILDGEMTFLVGGDLHRAPAGSTVVVPPETVHAFRNPGSSPARLLIMVLPGGFEGFFDETKTLRSPMSDAGQWQQINERWDTHVVGPPLEA